MGSESRGAFLSEGAGRVLVVEVQLQAALVTASAVVLGPVLQGLLAARTLQQRRHSDDREARWARVQWAVDHTLSEDDRKAS